MAKCKRRKNMLVKLTVGTGELGVETGWQGKENERITCSSDGQSM